MKRPPAFIRRAGPSTLRIEDKLLAVVVSVVVSVAIMIAISVSIMIPIMAAIAEIALTLALAFMRAKLSFPFGCPGMTAVDAAVFALPVAVKKSLSIVARRDPAGSHIRWPSPISFVPAVVASYGVPVTFDPEELRAGARRPKCNDAGSRRGTNSHSNGDLGKRGQGKE